MTAPYRKPYIESCVFIAYIKGEKKGASGDIDCRAIVDLIISDARRETYLIYTSALTLAEVHKSKRCDQPTPVENQNILDYFENEYVRIIELERKIATQANELCRTRTAKLDQPALKPNDAIHLASAMAAKCDVLLTWDPGLLKQRNTGIRIEAPQILGQVDMFGVDKPEASEDDRPQKS